MNKRHLAGFRLDAVLLQNSVVTLNWRKSVTCAHYVAVFDCRIPPFSSLLSLGCDSVVTRISLACNSQNRIGASLSRALGMPTIIPQTHSFPRSHTHSVLLVPFINLIRDLNKQIGVFFKGISDNDHVCTSFKGCSSLVNGVYTTADNEGNVNRLRTEAIILGLISFSAPLPASR